MRERLEDTDESALASHLGPRERRRLGAFFTPRPLVEAVLDALARHLTPGPLAVVDPACGAGAFLAAARRRWPQASLLGLDIDATSAATCRRRLAGAPATVLTGDALRGPGLDTLLAHIPAGASEVWVGNPPFQGTSPLLGDSDAYREACTWLAHPPPPGTSLRDDFIFFLLRASLRLQGRPGGALAFITSATLLDAFQHAPVRRTLLDRLALREVLSFSPGAFPGTRVRACATLWTAARLGGSPRFEGRPFHPAPPRHALRPEDAAARALHEAWTADGEPLRTLVPVSYAGLKTRFDELLVDDDAARLLARLEAFLRCRPAGLTSFARKWGLPERTWPKLQALHLMAATGIDVEPSAVRALHEVRPGPRLWRVRWCYLDRRLIPRGDHRLQGDFNPHSEPRKLVFSCNELPLWGAVLEAPGCVTAYRHTRFAPLLVPRGLLETGRPEGPAEPNLSPRGRALAAALGGPWSLFRRLATFLGSAPVQDTWAPEYATGLDVPVPLGLLATLPEATPLTGPPTLLQM